MRSSAPARRAGRVLLVEDDPEAALFSRYVLEKSARFEVTWTADPAAALTLAAAGPWALAVADFDLPGLSGAELAAALRRVAPRLPVILVTAHPRDAIADVAGRQPDGRLAGVRPDDILVKPFSASRLLAAVDAVCGAPARRCRT